MFESICVAYLNWMTLRIFGLFNLWTFVVTFAGIVLAQTLCSKFVSKLTNKKFYSSYFSNILL